MKLYLLLILSWLPSLYLFQEIQILSPRNLTNCNNNRCDFDLNFDVKIPQPYGDVKFVDPFRKYNDTKTFTNSQAFFTAKASQRFSIVDSRFEESLDCVCPPSSTSPVTTTGCQGHPPGPTEIQWEVEVPGSEPANDCPNKAFPAKCCYGLKVTSEEYFEVYTGITSTFDHLQVTYSKKDYNLIHGLTVGMADLNVTLLGLTNIMQPLASMAIIVDSFGNSYIVDKDMINLPGGHSTAKAGWWKQSVETTKTEDFKQFPSQISPLTHRFKSNLNITQARYLPKFSDLDIKNTYQIRPGNKILEARIVIKQDTQLEWYDYSSTGAYRNLMLLVDDVPQLVCISGPTICICTPGTTWNQQRCLPLKGKIRLFRPDNSIMTALIDANFGLSHDVASNLLTQSYILQPPSIYLNIHSDIAIQPIILHNAQPYELDAYNYTNPGKYIILEIYTYPCALILETDVESTYLTLTAKNTIVHINWKQPIFKIYDITGVHTKIPRKIYEDTQTTYIPGTDEVYDVINSPGSLLQAILRQMYNLWFWVTMLLWSLAWFFAFKKKVFDWSLAYLTFGTACLFPFWAIFLVPFYLVWCWYKARQQERDEEENYLQEPLRRSPQGFIQERTYRGDPPTDQQQENSSSSQSENYQQGNYYRQGSYQQGNFSSSQQGNYYRERNVQQGNASSRQQRTNPQGKTNFTRQEMMDLSNKKSSLYPDF